MAIYLDHAATTPLDPRVREVMLPYLTDFFGNPSSIHRFGREVRQAIDRARMQVADALQADPSRIVFTSGGTEADNLAIIGVAAWYKEQGKNHVITSQIEHHAVLDACKYLEREGFQVTYLPVDSQGMIRLADLQQAITPQTSLISIMYGNNEVGTIQPIQEIGEIARSKGVLFHTDAVQAFGMEEINVEQLPVDLMTVSAHKINGPKGVGALYFSKNVHLLPRVFGGAQEKRRRPGTENVPGIVGFGKAAEIAKAERTQHREHMWHLRKRFLDELTAQGVSFVVNGHPDLTLPHICNISFPGMETETLLINFDLEGIACSSSSACTSGTLTVSHVLKAMRLPEERTRSAVRFSFGKGNTELEMEQAAEKTAKIIRRLTTS
ncbi:cysteine desulfurase family protein [Thermoflavimicrobium dichotomicum]|uniref:cysteine desulfurase n=1 Tax=Thermoflavimicrobium dichotomicum TaxID=46223 RepID=A0A1I3MW76_9BACL|nr:cysteine desulfurase family protein [Thermoflavimicrobium dichotomicum]SFJ01172.1 cysteine desulfurase [Thermoflavimicrobium dichotomicum]